MGLDEENVVLELAPGGAAEACGLREGDFLQYGPWCGASVGDGVDGAGGSDGGLDGGSEGGDGEEGWGALEFGNAPD